MDRPAWSRRVGRTGRRAPLSRLLALPVLLAVVGGCGTGDDPASPGSTEAVRAEVTTPLAEVLVAQVELTGDPDWLASDEHGVWVQRASGELTLVDPTTNEPAGSVPLGDTQLCAGLGASFGAVWTCLGPDVVRVDPETLEVEARLALGKQAVQGHLVGGFDRVWVLTGDGSGLAGIDPTTNQVASEIDLPSRCTDVALGPDALWLACRVDDRVLRVDPASGEVLLDVTVANPVAVAVDEEVWVATSTSTLQLDPVSGEVVSEVDAPGDGGLVLDDESVWVRSLDEFLVRIDRQTDRRAQRIRADGLTSAGDLLVRDGELWTTAYDDQRLFRIDASGP